jgi:uncharacterized protein (UPF0297 family)
MVAFGIAFGYHRNNYGNEDCMRKCRGNKDLGMKNPIDWSVKSMGNIHETQYFGRLEKEPENEAKRILMTVSSALREKGYNPVNQIVGYILSGDPTYITSHQNARVLIRKLERDELLEELVKDYLNRNE